MSFSQEKKSIVLHQFALRLNEGFATLFEYLLVHNAYPQMRVHEYWTVNKLQHALKIDSVESIHPMTFDGDTVYEIEYYKGEWNFIFMAS